MAEKKKNNKNKAGAAAAVRSIAEPIARELGLSIWDIRFVKEGAAWYLRIFIDKPDGVSINDCERMSRAVDKPLDDIDFIEQSYYLEVCSPGIERELTRPEHFELMAGREVCVSFFRAVDGSKEVVATLVGLQGNDILLADIDGREFSIPRKEAASVKLCDDQPDILGSLDDMDGIEDMDEVDFEDDGNIIYDDE